MGGYERYTELLVNKLGRQEIARELRAALKGKVLRKVPLTPKQEFVKSLFGGFREIFGTFECLKDIEIYTGLYSYGKYKIPQSRVLAYHFTSHFNEIYIMYERLNTYCGTIRELYKNDSTRCLEFQRIEKGLKRVIASLKNINKVRGTHVHNYRYINERITDLELLEISSKIAEVNIDESLLKIAKLYRREFKSIVAKNNEEIEKLVDFYFDKVADFIFNSDGSIKYPADIK